jgi:MarR family transcriptional regulator for hemolysin
MKFEEDVDFDSWASRFSEFYEPETRLEKEFRLTRKLVLAARRYTSHADEWVRRATGHSRARWETLSALTFSEGPVATVQLASRISVRWPTLIRTLQDLERAGLVRREKNPKDRRSRLIFITAEGRRVMGRVQDALDPMRSRILAGFTPDELVAMEGMLDRLFTVLVTELPSVSEPPGIGRSRPPGS